jgi:serine/threonine-protein kinase
MPRDHYQLGELLGRGGMGQVHVARHSSGRLVAIKRVRNTLSLDRVVVDRLADEARLLRCVSHPNVVRGLEDGTDSDGLPFLVMDRAHGTPLNQLIIRYGGLPRERIAAIAAQLLAGLSAIHDAQIVHADLKSQNVLVDEVDIVTIIDFGLARALGAATEFDGVIAGTPAYMAPELIAGAPPSVAADLYAVATVIYEMLTGSTPFAGHISTILTRQLAEPVDPPSHRAPGRGISSAVDRVVMRGLEVSPAARFHTAGEFADALAAALDDGPLREPRMARGSAVLIARPTVLHRPVAANRTPGERVSERTESVIAVALSHAQQLIESHRLSLAARQLESALDALAPPADGEQPITASAWRIETVLAALYETLGKQDHARRLALVAYRHALRTGCPLAEARARALVDRLIVRSRRVPRSTRIPRPRRDTASDR